MKRIDKLLQAVEHMKNKTHLLCKTKEGELKTMNLLDAISTATPTRKGGGAAHRSLPPSHPI